MQPAHSCSHGEVVCCDERGLATFQLLRHRRNEPKSFLCAFDLLELNGTDLRWEPIEVRKATLASILRNSRPGVRLNEHLEHPPLEVVISSRYLVPRRSSRPPLPIRNSSDHLDEVMKMTDCVTSKIIGHRRNILRYSRLLATHLTDLEREYIHKQIAVEQSKIENLELQVKSAPHVSSHTEQPPDPS